LPVGCPRNTRGVPIGISSGIMVSIWWLLWAFVAGGFSGMLLISLIVVARSAAVRGSLDRR
jgi:hypothetical protein